MQPLRAADDTLMQSFQRGALERGAQRAVSKRAGATVVEVSGSHAVYVSQPKAVASLIANAASGVAVATR